MRNRKENPTNRMLLRIILCTAGSSCKWVGFVYVGLTIYAVWDAVKGLFAESNSAAGLI